MSRQVGLCENPPLAEVGLFTTVGNGAASSKWLLQELEELLAARTSSSSSVEAGL